MRLVSTGLGARTISSQPGLRANTVNRIIDKRGEHSERFRKEALKGAHLDEVRFDELFTLNRRKKPVPGAPTPVLPKPSTAGSGFGAPSRPGRSWLPPGMSEGASWRTAT